MDVLEGLGGGITEAEKKRAAAARDLIAKDMWASYQEYLEQRGN